MKIQKPNLMPLLVLMVLSTAVCGLLFTAEQILKYSYFITTPLKIILFLTLILGYRRWLALTGRRRAGAILHFKNLPLWRGIFLGGLCAGALYGGFYYLGGGIDFSAIKATLLAKNQIDVNSLSFYGVAAYIILGNSLLEEYFFRGFVCFSFADLGYKRTGMWFSALLFALYHLAIFANWFSLPYLLLALAGLFTIGLIFAWLNSAHRSVANSWLAHGIADLAIILIFLSMR